MSNEMIECETKNSQGLTKSSKILRLRHSKNKEFLIKNQNKRIAFTAHFLKKNCCVFV